MRYLLSFLMFLFVGCAHELNAQKSSALQYKNILNFKIGSSNSEEIQQLLGHPNERVEKDNYYTLRYNDPETGIQRLSLNFLKVNNLLSGYLWIPTKDEKEIYLPDAKASFKNAKYKENFENNENPHAISNVVSYIDDVIGVLIRYDMKTKTVEAIAKYDVNIRAPAVTDTSEKSPYRYGDEITVSK